MLSPFLRLAPATLARLRAESARVVVIGPSGWLGRAAIAMLDEAYEAHELRERIALFGSHARPVTAPSGIYLDCFSCDDLVKHDLSGSVVLHFGYLTKDKTTLMSVDDYVQANDAIQDCVLAAMRASPPRGLFFASSGAVYQGSAAATPNKTDNLYGWMKARHEAAFRAASNEANVTFINGRIFTLAGEFINKTELYALGSFLCDLKAGRPIHLHATQPVVRSYSYVGDVINLALALMLGRSSMSFDMCGIEPIEIGTLASLCAAVVGEPHAAIIRPPMSSEIPNRMIGDHQFFYRLMDDEHMDPLSLERQILATATYLGFEGLAVQ